MPDPGSPWPVLVVFACLTTRVSIVPVTLPQDFILNSPFIIASVSVSSCLIWLLLAPAVAGEAAARDVQTGMHPVTYTTPVSKTEYLGGRFLAAFVLNALILLGVQAGSLLAAYAPGVDPEIIGPFRPAAYLAAYAFIALPNAFIATTIQFSSALLSGRSMASYLGSMILFFLSLPVSVIVTFALAWPALGKMTDPIGMIGIMNAMMLEWTIVEKNIRMFVLEGPVLWNRLLWIGISMATLGFVCLRFRFAHRNEIDLWSRIARRFAAKKATLADTVPTRSESSIPLVRQTFGLAIHVRQTLAITWSSFTMIAKSPAGLFLLAVFPVGLFLVLPMELQHWGVPLLPRTDFLVTKYLTAPLTHVADYRVIYFHYSSDVPIVGQYVFFSADYTMHQDRWHDVDIRFFHHPGDRENIDRMVRSARASLDYYTSQFGPYPYRFLQFVEHPGLGMGMGVDGSGLITGSEGFFLLNPAGPWRGRRVRDRGARDGAPVVGRPARTRICRGSHCPVREPRVVLRDAGREERKGPGAAPAAHALHAGALSVAAHTHRPSVAPRNGPVRRLPQGSLRAIRTQ